MPALDPETLTFRYTCMYGAFTGREHDSSEFPIDWTVSISAGGWSVEGSAGQDVHVGDAF